MFAELTQFLRQSVDGLEGVERWSKCVEKGARRENALQHTTETVLLTLVILELLESQPPDFAYDRFEVLACAALHDVGEVGVGDTLYKRTACSFGQDLTH